MSLHAKRTQNVLVDLDMIAYAQSGKLFLNGTFDENALSGCAYDLRAGAQLTSRNRGIVFDLDDGPYVVDPGELITVQTEEQLDLKDPLLFGVIATSHTQLSQGLFHPITVIDPGFVGPLAITLVNAGTSGYRLNRKDRVAKMYLIPVAPVPDRIYGTTQKPRVREGSIEHSLYVERYGNRTASPDLPEFFGGPLRELAERVESLERNVDVARVTSRLAIYQKVSGGIWMVLAGAAGGVITQYWDKFLAWAGRILGN